MSQIDFAVNESFLEAIRADFRDHDNRQIYRDRLIDWNHPLSEAIDHADAIRADTGISVFGPLEVIAVHRVWYCADQLRLLIRTMDYPAELLRACAKTHILYAGYPLSLFDLDARHPHRFTVDGNSVRGLRDNDAYPRFATQPTVALRWYLLRITRRPEAQRVMAGEGSLYQRLAQGLPENQRIACAGEALFGLLLQEILVDAGSFRREGSAQHFRCHEAIRGAHIDLNTGVGNLWQIIPRPDDMFPEGCDLAIIFS